MSSSAPPKGSSVNAGIDICQRHCLRGHAVTRRRAGVSGKPAPGPPPGNPRQDGPMADPSDLKAMSAATYAATADHFDDAPLSFWSRFGTETVSRIGLRPGDHVL